MDKDPPSEVLGCLIGDVDGGFEQAFNLIHRGVG